ncbi:MAG: hypothetical protein ABR525_10620, partial [Candidatus Limnocylindria bacterium]
EDASLGLVGRISMVDSSLLEELLAALRVPVVAPAAIDTDGSILNVNGDAAAGAIAASVAARLLAFVTDVPGVRGKDGKVIARLDRDATKALVDDGTIEGGMLPKVEACLVAASTGCRAAIVSARDIDAAEAHPQRRRRPRSLAQGQPGCLPAVVARPGAARRRPGGHGLRGRRMNELNVRKQHRQQTLLRLVADKRLATQHDVVRALRAAGFAATQATVSRDIVELGLVKAPRDGAHVYAAPAAPPSSGGVDRLRRFCEEYPVQGAVAGNLVVLKTSPGTANALAIALDTSGFSDVIGTIAGDDTVFIAANDPARARGINKRLADFGVGRSL